MKGAYTEVEPKYPDWRDQLILELETRISELERENNRLAGLAADMADTSSRMQLQLILSGALKVPKSPGG